MENPVAYFDNAPSSPSTLPLMATHDNNLSPEESARLKELREALESEFATSENANSQSKPLRDIEELKPDFLGALKHIVKFSDNESLKAKVAMWGYDKLLDQGKASNDPIRELIEGLEAARVASTTTSD